MGDGGGADSEVDKETEKACVRRDWGGRNVC